MSESEKPPKKLTGWGKPGENLRPVEAHWLAGLVKEEHWLKGLVSEESSSEEPEAADLSEDEPEVTGSQWESWDVKPVETHWLSGLVEEEHWLKGLVREDEVERPREKTVDLEEMSYQELARAEALSSGLGVEEVEAAGRPPERTVGLDEVSPEELARAESQSVKIQPEESLEKSEVIETPDPVEMPPSLEASPPARLPETEEPPERPLRKAKPQAPEPEPESESVFSSRPVESSRLVRQRAIVYRALSVMMEAGIPIYGAFEFLAVQVEDERLSQACRRVAQELAQGKSLAKVALKEPVLFQESAARMLEVGMRTGKMVAALKKLAEDEEQRWGFRSRLTNQLIYPILLAGLALLAAIILPPLALTSLLEQVLRFTEEPPFLTLMILQISSALSSPKILTSLGLLAILFVLSLRLRVVQERVKEMEPMLWVLPGLGPFVRVVLSIRFLQLFAMMYEVGVPALQCLSLASKSTGSVVVGRLSQPMRSTLMAGGTLRESLEAADFLPRLCLEAVETGEQVGKIPAMMRSASSLLAAELEYRVEGLLALLEPILLTFLGVCVGVFALGCLLPILKLVEKL